MVSLLKLNPNGFINFLKKENIKRFYMVYNPETKQCESSHPQLQSIADAFNKDTVNYRKHEGVFFQVSSKYDSLYGGFTHKSNRGQAQGGQRYWQYDSMDAYFQDGLRLSNGMTNKNALAGLWWGGGKGIVSYNPENNRTDPKIREYLFKEYGKFNTSLRGAYITAEDIGTNVVDLGNIFSTTRFVTCIPKEVGGSGNPSDYTARGIVAGIESAFDYQGTTVKGKTICLQGVGNCGAQVAMHLVERGVGKIIAWDIFQNQVDSFRTRFAKHSNVEVHLVDQEGDKKMMETKCDLFSPCAVGAILNTESIAKLNCKIVCGAANNQLLDPSVHDAQLVKRGITYIPDFLVNRMGIVYCCDEQAGYVTDDYRINRHFDNKYEFGIHQSIHKLLKQCEKEGKSTGEMAVHMAEELSQMENPVYGHRGQQIINSLVKEKWHLQG